MTISVPNAPEMADRIAAAKHGDEGALAELYTAHFDHVYSYLRVALNDAAEAEEATQEIFMKVFRSLDRYENDGESFGDWLLAIARNHLVARLRKRSVRGNDVVSIAVESPDKASVSAEQTLRALGSASDEELMLLLERLPEAQRQAIVLGYVLDFGQRETARVLGRSEDETRKLQAAALASLRKRLSAAGRAVAGSTSRHAMRRYGARQGALQPTRSVSLLR